MGKQAYVWDGSAWQTFGTQLPNVPYSQKYGSQSVTMTADPTVAEVTFAVGSFTTAPSVFTQVTSTNSPIIRVTAKTASSFTVSITGLSSGTVTFDWYAVQPLV